MSTKVQRQQLIAKIVSSQNVTSQPKLRELLKKKGIKATQATVSRDLEDLGAVKVRTASGETTYAIPEFEPDRLSPPDQLKECSPSGLLMCSSTSRLLLCEHHQGALTSWHRHSIDLGCKVCSALLRVMTQCCAWLIQVIQPNDLQKTLNS